MKKLTVLWVLLAILMALLVLVFAGCSSTKDMNKSKTEQTESREKILEDSLRVVTSERNLFEQHYNELLYGSILFDTIVSHDTINHYNTVYITKDGDVKAEGNIRRVDLSKNILTDVVKKQDKVIDSLRDVKETEKIITKTITVEKTKYKKTSFFPIWLMLIAFVAGWVVRAKLGSTSFRLFNKKISI